MAKHLDLEEQEQLDQLKHFWNQYGNLITWVLIAVLWRHCRLERLAILATHAGGAGGSPVRRSRPCRHKPAMPRGWTAALPT
jgi:hypothetical protein